MIKISDRTDKLKILNKENMTYININYKAVCESLVRGNLENAYDEFRKCTNEWIDINNLVVYRAFLNSLNYAIYYYVLFRYDVSLNKCCLHCTILMHKEIHKDNFFDAAKLIIDEYHNEMISNNIIVTNPFLQTVFEYIDNNLDKTLGLEEIANEVHVNKSYLSQLFKSKTGYTFSTYVNNRKLNRARELLINTDKSISEISEECGYKSPTYFSSIFNKKTGLSPAKFRKNSSEFKKTKS